MLTALAKIQMQGFYKKSREKLNQCIEKTESRIFKNGFF
ncbi:hypothetical protein AB434_0439 [Heyndrickxia coagulans]|nr:hypothetical protein AB434_0439 [Heyndrickxia coagulans]